MDSTDLRDRLLREARDRGWAAAGVAAAAPLPLARERAMNAVESGRLEGMPWFSARRADVASDPAGRHPWARSVLALAWPHATAGSTPPPSEPGRPRGRMAAYALVRDRAGNPSDYHRVLTERIEELMQWLREEVGELRSHNFIDHGWAMDRPLAERAGLGFAGKHAGLLTLTAGSYVVLAEVLLSVALPPTAPVQRNCGSCTACLPACPTGAIVAPGVIDSRRCISYLTVEHRGSIPLELRPRMGTWALGCDLCQEACPVNQRLAPQPAEPGGASTSGGPVAHPDLIECLELDEEGFRSRFHGTAVWRTGRAGLARNAAIALGNAGDPEAAPALRRAADSDPDPVVRESAVWALGRLNPRSGVAGGR
jgi:epoxyqueuosine reductase